MKGEGVKGELVLKRRFQRSFQALSGSRRSRMSSHQNRIADQIAAFLLKQYALEEIALKGDLDKIVSDIRRLRWMTEEEVLPWSGEDPEKGVRIGMELHSIVRDRTTSPTLACRLLIGVASGILFGCGMSAVETRQTINRLLDTIEENANRRASFV